MRGPLTNASLAEKSSGQRPLSELPDPTRTGARFSTDYVARLREHSDPTEGERPPSPATSKRNDGPPVRASDSPGMTAGKDAAISRITSVRPVPEGALWQAAPTVRPGRAPPETTTFGSPSTLPAIALIPLPAPLPTVDLPALPEVPKAVVVLRPPGLAPVQPDEPTLSELVSASPMPSIVISLTLLQALILTLICLAGFSLGFLISR